MDVSCHLTPGFRHTRTTGSRRVQGRHIDGVALPVVLDDLDRDLRCVSPLAEAGRHARDEEQILVANGRRRPG